jgi:hypothetical protein
MAGSGVAEGELEKEAGEPEPLRSVLPVAERAEVRDFRRPCADDGRLGEPAPLPGEVTPAGGSDCVQDLPANSASSFEKISGLTVQILKLQTNLFSILGCRPTVVGIVRAHAVFISSLFDRRISLHKISKGRVSTKLHEKDGSEKVDSAVMRDITPASV